MRISSAMLMMAMALSGCGGGNNPGGSGSLPMDYLLFKAIPKDIGHNAAFEGTFSVPSTATVSYTITDTGCGLTCDTWNIGIAPSSELPGFESGGMWSAYANHNGVSTTSDSASVPAGAYAFAVRCTNIGDDCKFTFSVDALY